MNEKMDIVMTSWNRPQFTYTAIESIVRNTQSPYRLIVVDNGSEGSMQMQLRRMLDEGKIQTLVLFDHNYGLEYAKHRAMTFVDSRLFVSTDNDILAYEYHPDWLSRLEVLMDKYPEYAAIGCRPQILVGTGNIFEGKTEEVIPFTHVPGYLRIMRTDWVKHVGAWRDERELRGHEEYWISQKLQDQGFKVGWAREVCCWHLFGEENWGYGNLPVEKHGHSPVSALPHDNASEILDKTGIAI